MLIGSETTAVFEGGTVVTAEPTYGADVLLPALVDTEEMVE